MNTFEFKPDNKRETMNLICGCGFDIFGNLEHTHLEFQFVAYSF